VIRDVLLAASQPAQRLKYLKDFDAVDEAVNPAAALRLASRAVRVTGRLLEGMSDQYAVTAKPAAWITRVGSVFWGLVEASLPGAAGELLFRRWVHLLYLFAALMVVGGWLTGTPGVQRFGLLVFGVTLVVHLAILAVRDVIHRRRFRWLVVGIGLVLVTLAVLAVIGAFYLPEAWHALLARMPHALVAWIPRSSA
jgi:hypothetical protein